MHIEDRAIGVLKRLKVVSLVEKTLIIKDRFNGKKSNNSKEERLLKRHIEMVSSICEDELRAELDEKLEKLKNEIDQGKYKGIIVYPEAINWEPVQRPHHLLRKLAEKGYLCFFCDHKEDLDFTIEERFKNVYIVNHQEKLLPLLKDKKCIVLITYYMQYIFSQFLTNKLIWLDVVDRLDFMALYNSYSKSIWDKIIDTAYLVTYSADNLRDYLKKRQDAILLENAVSSENFGDNEMKVDIDGIDKRLPVIGYFGAVEEWIDFELIKKIESSYNVVIIGKVNPSIDVKRYDFSRVIFLGPKPFEELKSYARTFDVAMIPFKINEVTNSVSPLKFFEYMALNLPVVSTDIKEMQKYESSIVRIINEKNVIRGIKDVLAVPQAQVKKECKKILKNNTWECRVNQIIDLL